MRYEVTIKIVIKTPRDKERVIHQVESLFDFGTIGESIVDGLKLNESPRLSSVSVKRASTSHLQ
jgi:hypothetical protein